MSTLARREKERRTTDNNELEEALLPTEKREEVVIDEQDQLLLVTTTESDDDGQANRGVNRKSKCRDWPFALLFLIHVALLISIAITWGAPALNLPVQFDDDEENGKIVSMNFKGLPILFASAGVGSGVLSFLILMVMTRFAKRLIQFSVLFNIFVSLLVMVTCTFQGYDVGAIIAFLVFMGGCFYALATWDQIPFAASNLATALTAVRANIGVILIPYLVCIIGCGYCVIWVLALIGVHLHEDNCQKDGHCDPVPGWIWVMFLLTFFWSQEVLRNIVRVTVAGVVGTWWFAREEASSSCSRSILDSMLRSTTTSFGSICLGSLLVGLASLLKFWALDARSRGRPGSFTLCLADCLMEVVDRFNSYAFTFVALYGYNFTESGTKVAALFYSRGWHLIVSNALISRILAWASLVIGSMTAVVCMITVDSHSGWLTGVPDDHRSLVSFFCGLLVGTLMANVLMSIVSSAVDCVLVCFAEAPIQLRMFSPDLSDAMEEAWVTAYPTEYRRMEPLDAPV